MMFLGARTVIIVSFLCGGARLEQSVIDGSYVSVSLFPYVRPLEDPFVLNVTEPDIRVMLQVISSRFFRIFTAIADSSTKTGQMSRGLLTAQVASQMNLESNSLLLQVVLTVSHENLEDDLQHATETAKAANAVFQGTVSGIAVAAGDLTNTTWVQSLIEVIQQLRGDLFVCKVDLGVILGLQDCDTEFKWKLGQSDKSKQSPQLPNATKALLRQVDFVVFYQNRFVFLREKGSLVKDSYRPESFMKCEGIIRQEFGDKMGVHLHFAWSSRGGQYFRANVLTNAWKALGSWAAKRRSIVFLSDAFDSAVRSLIHSDPSASYRGWWELGGNFSLGQPLSQDSFVEKLLAEENIKNNHHEYSKSTISSTPLGNPMITPSSEWTPEGTVSAWQFVGIMVGILFVGVIVSVLVIRCVNGNSSEEYRSHGMRVNE